MLPNSKSILRDFSALADFSNLINSTHDIDFNLNNLLLTCFSKLLTTKGIIYLLENEKFTPKLVKGIQSNNNELNEIEQGQKVISEIRLTLPENEFPIVMEIKSAKGIIGYIVLGRKFDGTDYSQNDSIFLEMILNIAASAIQNTLDFNELNQVNRKLDGKVNQLKSLFDLSKEFSGALEVEQVTKLLTYSLLGQMMVAKYAIVTCSNGELKILDNKFPSEKLTSAFKKCDVNKLNEAIAGEKVGPAFPELDELKIRAIIPMKINQQTRGLILLGNRLNNLEYSKTDLEFVSSLASIAIISIENVKLVQEAIEKQKMEKELETARNIQKSLLPETIPQSDIFDIAAISYSARQVGGDYYDVIELDENRTLIAIADVSGKGVQAALLMANLQAFLKTISKQNLELHEASNLLNDLVSENTRLGNFITFFWGIIDKQKMEFTYVNAGHNPPLFIRKSNIGYLKIGGMLLGVMKTITPYKSETVELKSNDLIVLFTDGITEAMNEQNIEYSDERLQNLILNNHESSAQDYINLIMSDLKIHVQNSEQSDDITSLILRIK